MLFIDLHTNQICMPSYELLLCDPISKPPILKCLSRTSNPTVSWLTSVQQRGALIGGNAGLHKAAERTYCVC